MGLREKRRGFTLLELLVVIAIIGIFASIVIAIISVNHAKSLDTQRLQNLRDISQDLMLISLKSNPDIGCYGDPGLNMLTQCSNDGAPLARYKDPVAPNTPCKGHNYGPASTAPCEYTIGSDWGGLSAYGVNTNAAEVDDYEVCTFLQSKVGVYGPGLVSITSTTSGTIVNGCF